MKRDLDLVRLVLMATEAASSPLDNRAPLAL